MGHATEVATHSGLLKILYRVPAAVALLGIMFSVADCVAQDDRAEIPAVPRKIQKKKDAGPRALAVVQLAASGKVSLVPICILINGKFWDATAYKADPIPMALEPGTVYEAERAGMSQGLFTVGSALHSNAANVPTPWLGTGAWVPAGTEKPDSTMKTDITPVGIDLSDAPPYLTKDPKKLAPAAAPPAAAPSSPGQPSQASKPSASSSSDEPPRLTKPAEPPPQDSKPNETKAADAKAPDKPKAPESDSGADEANRPRLRRGKPIAPLPDDEFPGYSKPGASSSSNSGKIVAVAAAPGAVQLIPAVSDAHGPDPHSFGFEWLKDEEVERRQQMMALAKEQLKSYLAAQAKATTTPPPSAPAAHRKSPEKPLEPIFENVRMTAYDLWTNNQPVLIFSCEAHMPPTAAGSLLDLKYSVLLVAYPDIYNNLHKLYVGITDPRHLDVTPRLELVDAVDADGDGRGELLFKETSDQGSGWIVYRATADSLWKMFDSLSAE